MIAFGCAITKGRLYERYAELQVKPTNMKVRHRFPLPGHWTPQNPPRGFSHFSSFGCPEACTFCCSPLVTSKKFRAIAAISGENDP